MKTATKERGILMHARSVNNILAGRKTQTRRIVKQQPLPPSENTKEIRFDDEGGGRWCCRRYCHDHIPPHEDFMRCPLGQPGDRLWVRETWKDVIGTKGLEDGGTVYDPTAVYYKASPEVVSYHEHYSHDRVYLGAIQDSVLAEMDHETHRKWRPSLFMPRWASRITLEIVSVRVERVQDISLEDIAAEGVNVMWEAMGRGDSSIGPAAYDDFANLWDNTNGKGAWKRNDWCWCIEFRRVDQ